MRCGLKVCVWFPTQPLPCMRSLHVLSCLLVESGVKLLFLIERIMDSNKECWCWGNITPHSCFLLSIFPGSFTLSISCCLFLVCISHIALTFSRLSLILSIFLSSSLNLSTSLLPQLSKSLQLSLPMFLCLSCFLLLSLHLSVELSCFLATNQNHEGDIAPAIGVCTVFINHAIHVTN